MTKVIIAFRSFANAPKDSRNLREPHIYPTLGFEPGTKEINCVLRSYLDVTLRGWKSDS
jgi:hypothetical protein